MAKKSALAAFGGGVHHCPAKPPPPLLDSKDYQNLPGALCQFFCEIRRIDKEPYRASSVRVYYASISRSMNDIDPGLRLNDDPRFHKLRKTVDGLIRTLRKKENPTPKQAQEITEATELDLKSRGFLSYDTPRALLSALIFEVGKLFGLRGGSELRNVRRGQFQTTNIGPGLVKVTLHEDVTKTNHAGLSGGAGTGIRGPHLEDPNTSFSLSSLMAYYTQRLPHDVDLSKTFWFKPLKTVREGVWFSKKPIGEKILANFLKGLMNEAGYG